MARVKNNPYPTGLNFGGAAAQRLEALLQVKAAENARRIPCSHCGLMILPETMRRHTDIVHDEDAA